MKKNIEFRRSQRNSPVGTHILVMLVTDRCEHYKSQAGYRTGLVNYNERHILSQMGHITPKKTKMVAIYLKSSIKKMLALIK